MSLKITTKIEGLGLSLDGLEQMKASTQKGVMRRVGRDALKPFAELWPQLVGHLTGELAESGGVGSKLSRSQRAEHERESTVEVFAGPGPNPQAIQDEFGNEHQAPRGGVRRAWEQTQDQVLQNVVTGFRTEIDKTAARLEKKAARLAVKKG